MNYYQNPVMSLLRRSCGVIVQVKVVLKRTVVGETFRQPERKSSSESSEESFVIRMFYVWFVETDWSCFA